MKKNILALGAVSVLATGLCDVAPAAKRANILFIIADDASFEHFGVNGCTWVNTPNIDRVAEQGINFTTAYTPNPKCGPSRSVLITGRNPWQLGAAINHDAVFDKKIKTYAETLAEHGYRIGFTGKGWRPGDSQGRDLLGKEVDQHRVKKAPSKKISKKDYAKNFEHFLTDSDSSKPFVFWLGCHEPHRAYEFKSGVKSGKTLDTIPEVPSYWPDTEAVGHDMLDYALDVENFDKHVGGCIDALRRQGNLENTLADAAGIQLDQSDPKDGQSFLPQIVGKPTTPRTHVLCHYQPYWKFGGKNAGAFVRTDRFKLYADGRFYDIANDLDEANNLAGSISGERAMSAHKTLQKLIEQIPPVPQRQQRKYRASDQSRLAAREINTIFRSLNEY